MDNLTLENNKVLFITTKNLDYIRNTQEIELLKQTAGGLTVLGGLKGSSARRMFLTYVRLLFCPLKKYDTVFIGFSPQMVLPFFGWKFRNKAVVIDFFISVYDTFVFDRKRFRDGSLPARICKWLDKRTLDHADFCICDTNAHGDYFASEFGIPRDNFHTLYLHADTEIYYPRPQVKPEETKGRFIVLYFGTVLPLQGVDIITSAMRALADDERFFFYFIGPLKDKVEASNIRYFDWLSQDKLAEYIACADLCLAGHFNANIEKAKRTIPGKAYIYHEMEKPMLLGDNPANRELFSEDMEGIYFAPMGDAEALKERIVEIYELQNNCGIDAEEAKTNA